MAGSTNPTRVVTGVVRCSYVHLTKPYSQDPVKQEPKYSVVILIPKSDTKTLNKIKAAIEAAKEQGKTQKWGGSTKGVTTTLHDGDDEEKVDHERNPEYAGHYYMTVSAKESNRPGIVDRDLNKILDESEIYSGMYARVSINAFAYLYQGKKGVSFGLNNVQKVKDGEPLGGRTSAESDFDDDEDLGDDDMI